MPLPWGPVEPAETASADNGSVLAPAGIPEDPGELEPVYPGPAVLSSACRLHGAFYDG